MNEFCMVMQRILLTTSYTSSFVFSWDISIISLQFVHYLCVQEREEAIIRSSTGHSDEAKVNYT